MADKRFEKLYTQGVVEVIEIWVDQYTGVNYLWHSSGNAGGLTPWSPPFLKNKKHPRCFQAPGVFFA